jgi:hypothetical protein
MSCGFTRCYEGDSDVHQWRLHSPTRDFHFLHLQMTRLVPLLLLATGKRWVWGSMSLLAVSQLVYLPLASSSGLSSCDFPRDLESLFCRKIFAPSSTLGSSYKKATFMLTTTPTDPFHSQCHSNGSRAQKSNRLGCRMDADCVR